MSKIQFKIAFALFPAPCKKSQGCCPPTACSPTRKKQSPGTAISPVKLLAGVLTILLALVLGMFGKNTSRPTPVPMATPQFNTSGAMSSFNTSLLSNSGGTNTPMFSAFSSNPGPSSGLGPFELLARDIGYNQGVGYILPASAVDESRFDYTFPG